MPQDQTDASVDLGPKPDAEIEPGEPNPGGPDAVPEIDEVIPADLSVADNPAVDEDAAPDELQETEDTSTEGTDDGADGTAPDQGEPTE